MYLLLHHISAIIHDEYQWAAITEQAEAKDFDLLDHP
jgi:hypothetical protein